jgi:ferredoxin
LNSPESLIFKLKQISGQEGLLAPAEVSFSKLSLHQHKNFNMSEEVKKHLLNVKGKYYVDCETCLDHEICVDEAPNNFKMDLENYCAYVFKQPETAEEEVQCHQAFLACPVEAIHNDGDKF